ncbi:MAG TPA: ABC transporter substrate-binding protein, partial [Verrucomicrobiae bacterium]|nr:ABC transporter substrate-binding protein [Verrucomicrobiae bacterium]
NNGFSQANTGVPGAKIAGELGGFPYWATTAAPVKQFATVMAKYQPQATYDNAETTAAWAELQLFKQALSKTTGNVTPATVTKAYNTNVKNVTLNGLLPKPITFSATTKGQPNVTCYWLFKWKVGQKTPTTATVGKSGNGMSGALQSTCQTAAQLGK